MAHIPGYDRHAMDERHGRNESIAIGARIWNMESCAALGHGCINLKDATREVGILLLCLVPRRLYGVLWEYDFSILGGLGLAAFITLVAYVTRLKFGTSLETFFRYGPPAAFFGAASYWIFVFARPEPPKPTLKISSKERVSLLELWIKAMKAVGKRLGMRYAVVPLPERER